MSLLQVKVFQLWMYSMDRTQRVKLGKTMELQHIEKNAGGRYSVSISLWRKYALCRVLLLWFVISSSSLCWSGRCDFRWGLSSAYRLKWKWSESAYAPWSRKCRVRDLFRRATDLAGRLRAAVDRHCWSTTEIRRLDVHLRTEYVQTNVIISHLQTSTPLCRLSFSF